MSLGILGAERRKIIVRLNDSLEQSNALGRHPQGYRLHARGQITFAGAASHGFSGIGLRPVDRVPAMSGQ